MAAAADIIEGRSSEPQAVVIAHGRFTSPEQQLANFLGWNDRFDLGFSSKQCGAVDNPPSVAWNDPIESLTLCWTLGTLKETLDVKLTIMRYVYGDYNVYLNSDFKIDAEHLSLVEGAPEFVPNRIWWEVINFGANRNKSPEQVPAATAAGLQVFDAACQHKVNVNHHNGGNTPYWDVPGLRVKVERVLAYLYVPYINGCSDGTVVIGVDLASDASSGYVEPEVELQF